MSISNLLGAKVNPMILSFSSHLYEKNEPFFVLLHIIKCREI